jgi:hypothetical protein
MSLSFLFFFLKGLLRPAPYFFPPASIRLSGMDLSLNIDQGPISATRPSMPKANPQFGR